MFIYPVVGPKMISTSVWPFVAVSTAVPVQRCGSLVTASVEFSRGNNVLRLRGAWLMPSTFGYVRTSPPRPIPVTLDGDTLLLEVASSPGRIVGDASGRWGIGAVPNSGPAAALHVFALPELAQGSG